MKSEAAPPSNGRGVGARLAPDHEFKQGDVCGDWTIVRFVAEGGMGEVYEVRGVYGRKRGALKRIRAQHATRADFGERFETEIRILAELEHPYIVGLLHAGLHRGSPYFVMEWLEGVTLRDMMNFRREPFSLEEALFYAICIADALCAAHGEGILHRDLKPENVFMLKRSGLKVLDFGLGKLAEGNRASTSERLGGMCTVHYAAPEQLDRGAPPDDRTDVYALALIFVEMVTSFWAFADAPGVLPPKDIARANQLFAAPNSLRKLLPSCPPSLAALIDAALNKDKGRRPRSTEFLHRLREERRALRAKLRATVEGDLEEADSADEPPRAHTERTQEASVIRVIPVLRTETLPPAQPPGDPTAAGNPAPPVIRTIKMNAPREEDLEAARRGARAGDATTGHGRSATLPPEPLAARPVLPGDSPPGPAAAPVPIPDSAAADAREGLMVRDSFSSRPTLPWRAPKAREATNSLTPTHDHATRASSGSASARARIPIWAGPIVGIALSSILFAVIKIARHREASPSASAPSASIAVVAPPPPAEAVAPAETAVPAELAAPAETAAPAKSAVPAESTAPTAESAQTSAPSAVPARSAAARRAPPPFARAATAAPGQPQSPVPRASTTVPEPIFTRPKAEPTPTRNRVFGTED